MHFTHIPRGFIFVYLFIYLFAAVTRNLRSQHTLRDFHADLEG